MHQRHCRRQNNDWMSHVNDLCLCVAFGSVRLQLQVNSSSSSSSPLIDFVMPSNPLDQYQKLLTREQHENDKYVVIDAKWFEQWKRYVGLETPAEKHNSPGPIDFSKLIDPSTIDHPDGVQLRLDAVEGNDYTFIPLELYQELVQTFKKIGTEIVRKVIPSGDFQTVIEAYLVPLRVRKARQYASTTKQIYRSRRTKLDDLKNDLCRMFNLSIDSPSNLSHQSLRSPLNQLGSDRSASRCDVGRCRSVEERSDYVRAEQRLAQQHFAGAGRNVVHARPLRTFQFRQHLFYEFGLAMHFECSGLN